MHDNTTLVGHLWNDSGYKVIYSDVLLYQECLFYMLNVKWCPPLMKMIETYSIDFEPLPRERWQLCQRGQGHPHGVWQHTFLATLWWGSSFVGDGWPTYKRFSPGTWSYLLPVPHTSIPDGKWGSWLSGEILHIALGHNYNPHSLVWDVIEGLRRIYGVWGGGMVRTAT